MRRSVSYRRHQEILADTHRRHQQELGQAQARLTDAQARIAQLVEDRDRLRGERDQFKQDRDNQAKTSAAECARLEQELEGARQPDVEALRRRIRHLEGQLDAATGLNSAAVALGATWQERREQKMRYDA